VDGCLNLLNLRNAIGTRTSEMTTAEDYAAPPVRAWRAPYPTFSHFRTALTRPRRFGSADLLDSFSLVREGMSVNAASVLHAALRSLSVIDDRDHPTTSLLRLEHPDQEFPALCREIAARCYGWVVLDPPGQVSLEDLKAQFERRASASTAEKAVAFYRKLAEAGGADFQLYASGRSARRPSGATNPKFRAGALDQGQPLPEQAASAAVEALQRLASVAAPADEWTAAYKAVADSLAHLLPKS
jgi:hypothetical protein